MDKKNKTPFTFVTYKYYANYRQLTKVNKLKLWVYISASCRILQLIKNVIP